MSYRSIPEIVSTVERYFHVHIGGVKGRKRNRSIVVPRQVAMYLSRELTGFSLMEIGASFRRDHTTIMHGIMMTKLRMTLDPEFHARVDYLTEMLAPKGKPVLAWCSCVRGAGS